MSEQKATNVHWHGGEINRPERAQLLGHGGATLWFTGLSGSGKSTIAVALEQALYQRGVLVYRLDGDNIRLGINKNLGFSAEDRAANIRRAQVRAQLRDRILRQPHLVEQLRDRRVERRRLPFPRDSLPRDGGELKGGGVQRLHALRLQLLLQRLSRLVVAVSASPALCLRGLRLLPLEASR